MPKKKTKPKLRRAAGRSGKKTPRASTSKAGKTAKKKTAKKKSPRSKPVKKTTRPKSSKKPARKKAQKKPLKKRLARKPTKKVIRKKVAKAPAKKKPAPGKKTARRKKKPKALPRPASRRGPSKEKLYVLSFDTLVQHNGEGDMPEPIKEYMRASRGRLPPYMPLPKGPVKFRMGIEFSSARAVTWTGRGPLPDSVIRHIMEHGTLPRFGDDSALLVDDTDTP